MYVCDVDVCGDVVLSYEATMYYAEDSKCSAVNGQWFVGLEGRTLC